MQFTLVALLSLVAVTFASPIALPDRLDDITARSPQVETEAAAMSDANGDVISFDSTAVYQAATANGQ